MGCRQRTRKRFWSKKDVRGTTASGN
jgi:hypothetical protein